MAERRKSPKKVEKWKLDKATLSHGKPENFRIAAETEMEIAWQ